MKPGIWLTAAFFLCAAVTIMAHPSSGIVVNEQGEVFFIHSGRGLAKLDREGKLTYVQQSKGGHWLCLDRQGSFSRTQPKHFERVTPEGVHPAIIFADGGALIVVCRDGNLHLQTGASVESHWRGVARGQPLRAEMDKCERRRERRLASARAKGCLRWKSDNIGCD